MKIIKEPAWTPSTREEVLSVLWLIAAAACRLAEFHFLVVYGCFLQAFLSSFFAISFSFKEYKEESKDEQ